MIAILTPEYLKRQPDHIVKIFEELEDKLLEDIANNIEKYMTLSETAGYRLAMMQEMGYDLNQVSKEIAKTISLSEAELDRLMRHSSQISYDDDRDRYKQGGKALPKLVDNPRMLDFIDKSIKQTKGSLKNLSGTMGFIDKGKFKGIDTFNRDVVDAAIFQVASGAYDHTTALRQAVKKLGDSGIRSIDYASGRAYHIESAVRMTVLTGLNQITGHMSLANAEMMDQDIMEITAHMGARPSHAEWQGELVSLSGADGYLNLDDIGYDDVAGFQGANCRHGWFPFFEGISVRSYTEQDLEDLEGESIVFDGKEYTYYEATQKQRAMERQMRQTQRQIQAYEGAGLSNDALSAKIKLMGQRDLYDDFSKTAGIRAKYERVGVYSNKGPSPVAPKPTSTGTDSLDTIKKQGWYSNIRDENKDSLLEHFKNMTDPELKIFEDYGHMIKGEFYRYNDDAYYSPAFEEIVLNIGRQSDKDRAIGDSQSNITFFHEVGHLFDYQTVSGSSWRRDLPDIDDIARSDFLDKANSIIRDWNAKNNDQIKELNSLARMNREQKRAIILDLFDDPHIKSSVSDIAEGLTNGRVHGRYGHGSDYWRRPDALAGETIAHVFEAKITKGERQAALKEYFPKTYEYIDKYIDDLARR